MNRKQQRAAYFPEYIFERDYQSAHLGKRWSIHAKIATCRHVEISLGTENSRRATDDNRITLCTNDVGAKFKRAATTAMTGVKLHTLRLFGS
jgi:hypothetical protein